MKTTQHLLAVLLASQFALAQAQSNTIDQTETINITGTPIATPLIAGAVTIIDDQHIRNSGALGLTDLLRTVSGVNVSQSGAMGSLTELRFRGSESNHVLVLVDGVEINDNAQGGLVDFSHIILANIERIEVLKGPQSALWGSNAIAGIISITTKQASTKQLSPSFGLGFGDRDTLQANASVKQQVNNLQYAISANIIRTDGENISRVGNEPDGYNNSSVGAKLSYKLNPQHNISANARIVNYTSDFDATDFSTGFVADANNQSKGEQLQLGANWHYQGDDQQYSQRLSVQYNEQSNDNFTAQAFSGASEGSKLRILWNNRFLLANNSWINAGLESVNEQFEQSGPIGFGDPNQKQSNSSYSLVSSGQYAYNEHLHLSASYRYDNNDKFKNAASYRLGSSYIINTDWRAFVSYGKAIKNPSYTERFGFFPQTFLGNPNLTPEVQYSTEAGLAGSFEQVDVQVNLFSATLENEILGFVFDADSGQFTANNATTDSKRKGVEVSLNGSVSDIDYALQYAYLDASENADTELRRARHTGSANLQYNISNAHAVYVQADYTGTRFDRFFAPFPAPSEVLALDAYWLVSANYKYQHNENLTVNLRLSNVLNEQYEDVVGFSGESSRAFVSMQYAW
ncbi:MAG: TonB-dependent receptor [Glaciecola sp.]